LQPQESSCYFAIAQISFQITRNCPRAPRSIARGFRSSPWSLNKSPGESQSAADCLPGWGLLITNVQMATTSVLPSSVERSSSRRHQQSTPSRSQSTRTRSSDVPPSPSRADRQTSSRHRAVGESNNNDETVNVAAQSSRRSSSRDRPQPSRTESSRSGHHHHHRSSHSRDTMATSVANGGGPAPIVTAQESRQSGKSGKSRTTIPAPSGTFVLGKTVSQLLLSC
jgi:hypothetical protein